MSNTMWVSSPTTKAPKMLGKSGALVYFAKAIPMKTVPTVSNTAKGPMRGPLSFWIKFCSLMVDVLTMDEEKHLIDRQPEWIWKSCCCQIDKRAAKFFTQFLLSVILLVVCFVQLMVGDENVNGPVWGLVGTIVGYWFESPSRVL